MSRLGGLWRAMPWTAGLFALGAIAISGLPPLNGFVSEWLVYLGLFDAVTSRSPAGWAAMPAVIFLGVTGALALATFAKAGAVVFLGVPRTKAAVHAHECGLLMRAPMLVLAGACVAIGLAPVLFWPAVTNAIDTWHPAWTTTETPAPLGLLGPVHVVLAVTFVAGAIWLWRRSHARGLRRGLTWDCGYAAPTARMQYTAGSFADIATGWFFWALQPVRTLRRPHGAFPLHASSMTRLPDPVLAWAIAPVSGVVMGVSSAVRRLQHGRLQFYIVYVVAGLAALGLIVFLGGTP
jgi:hydrogenase-4 component B